ncbi:class I SAM-dependent methyltransferase [Paenibacillus sp. Marseille-Q4541]|uniref:tRNA (mnm(5)s(2)U34)-methyltransferase n=1 Tax=Paenibacillus sp. Marseille-Q4541 TaxID=2831522 RepID=UPI001BA66D78|nr:class I SAM-dependent methyltransferase [Paenibacillus sp. Marseille-Q4541]
MGFLSVLSCAHNWTADRLRYGDTAIDATVGTGADTLFLARTVGAKGHIYGFDIQEQALKLADSRFAGVADQATLAPVTLLQKSHGDMKSYIPSHLHGHIGAVMFNLGYLPVDQADPSVITLTDTTITALEASLDLLRPKGILTVVLYPGHKGGDEEAHAVSEWASKLPVKIGQAVTYRQLQRATSPYLIAIEKK